MYFHSHLLCQLVLLTKRSGNVDDRRNTSRFCKVPLKSELLIYREVPRVLQGQLMRHYTSVRERQFIQLSIFSSLRCYKNWKENLLVLNRRRRFLGRFILFYCSESFSRSFVRCIKVIIERRMAKKHIFQFLVNQINIFAC